MKQYYISSNNDPIGPLTFEELKNTNLSNDTLVWFEGLPEWKRAHEIEELAHLFQSVPPPVPSFSKPPPIPVNDDIDENSGYAFFGIGRNTILIIIIAVIIVVFAALYNYQEKDRIEQANKATEVHNEQIESQQKQIDAQQQRIAEQEQIETQRRKEATDKRLFEIRDLLDKNYTALEEAKTHLNDVTGFKLFRSSSERNEQITSAQNSIEAIKQEIKSLEAEYEQLNPTK